MLRLASHTAELVAFPGAGTSLRQALMPQLKQHRLPEHLVEALLREAAFFEGRGIDRALTHVLAARMRLEPLDLAKASEIFLIGPSGAGVSAVAAKLRHQAAAMERKITIESRSFHPRNVRARTAFSALTERRGVEIVGVVSALADAEETGEIISAFRLERLIVTGLDMARRLGGLTAAATQGARLAHVTSSPDEDAPLEVLSPRELALMLLR